MSDVKQYWILKAQHDAIGLRLKALRNKILDRYEAGQTAVDNLTVKIELRRSSPKIDEGVLWALLEEKNLVAECTHVTINEQAVKQAFIEGKITDSDLRAFNLGSTITPALSVNLTEDYVQGNDESIRERPRAGALYDWPDGEATKEISGNAESLGETESHPQADVSQ